MDRCACLQESHKHVDDADLEVEIQRELEEEEEALRNAWKCRQREQSSLLHAAVSYTLFTRGSWLLRLARAFLKLAVRAHVELDSCIFLQYTPLLSQL